MGFNYGRKRAEMEEQFEIMAEAYRDAGVSEDMIEILHRMYLDELNNDRRYYTHTQSYGLQPSGDETADESNTPLLKKYFESFSTRQWEICE